MKLRDWLLGLLSGGALLFLFITANDDELRNAILSLIFEDRPGLQLFALALLHGFIGYQFGLESGHKRGLDDAADERRLAEFDAWLKSLDGDIK